MDEPYYTDKALEVAVDLDSAVQPVRNMWIRRGLEPTSGCQRKERNIAGLIHAQACAGYSCYTVAPSLTWQRSSEHRFTRGKDRAAFPYQHTRNAGPTAITATAAAGRNTRVQGITTTVDDSISWTTRCIAQQTAETVRETATGSYT